MKKGKFVDEKIILLKEAYQSKTEGYDLLTDEIPIHKRRVYFRWFPLFDEEFRILLPEDFTRMSEPIARIRYISSYRPPVILSGPSYDENFGFHLLKYEGEEPERLIQRMQNTVSRYTPETVFYETGSIEMLEMAGSWFEYKNFTLNEETYNMQFVIRLGFDLLAGTFNCRMLFYDEWKPLVLQLLEKIERSGKRRGVNAGR